jgi:hypothetical protein
MSKTAQSTEEETIERWSTLPLGRKLLDTALLAHVTLLILSGLLFVFAFDHTIQNSIPIFCILLLTMLLWVVRYRLSDKRVSFESRRVFIIEWTVGAVVIVGLSILVLLFYPGTW